MALNQSALLNLLAEVKLTAVTDRIRVTTEKLYQGLIDAEVTAFIGAAAFEHSSERTTHRNGSRPRVLTTTAGDLELTFPKVRQGGPRQQNQKARPVAKQFVNDVATHL